jgi:hypothetical protein
MAVILDMRLQARAGAALPSEARRRAAFAFSHVSAKSKGNQSATFSPAEPGRNSRKSIIY